MKRNFSSNAINYWAKLDAGKVYHFYNHGVGRDNLFLEDANYHFFIEKWKKYFGHYMDVYAYCLMPNHFHVLGKFKPITEQIRQQIQKEQTSKSRAYVEGRITITTFYESQFKRFFTSYSRAYGKRYNRVGSLFRAKFKRTLIRNKARFMDKLFYIHHNPIHHRFTWTYQAYRYSSYHDYLNQNGDFIYLPILKYFGDTPEEAIEGFFQAHEIYRLTYLSVNSKFSDK